MKSLVVKCLALLLLAVSAIFFSIFHHSKLPYFDAFDEASHYDYVLALQRGEVPKWGEKLDQETLRTAECLGSSWTEPGNCEEKQRNPELVGALGFNYEVQQPPLPYLPYVAASLEYEDPLDNLNRMRNVGGSIWIFLTACAIFLLAKTQKLSTFETVAVGALVLLNPAQVHAFSTVNNDAAVAFSSLIFLTFLAFPKSLPKWSAIAVGVLLGLTKGLLVLVPIAAWVVLWSSNRARRDAFERWRIKLAGLVSITSVSTFVAYTQIQQLTSKLDSKIVLEALLGFSKSETPQASMVISSLTNQFSPFSGQIFLSGLGESASFSALNFLVIMTVGAIAFGSQSTDLPVSRENYVTQKSLVQIWLLIAVSLSVSWPAFLYIQGNYIFDAPQRYGLMSVPFLALAIARFTSQQIKKLTRKKPER